MFLSKRSNGFWYLWFDDERGKRRKVSTHCRLKSDALTFLRDFKEKVKKLKHRLTHKTLNEFFSDFQSYSQSIHTLSTQQSAVSAFREFIRIVGDRQLSELGVRDIEGFLAIKKSEASDWTVKRCYSTLASAFETAVRWNYIAVNPFRNVQKPKTSEVQPLFLTREEMQLLLRAIDNNNFKDLCLVAVFTGLRLGELLNLQWSNVDLVARVIHVRNSDTFTTKSKKNRSIPISGQLYLLLAEMKMSASTELVFHNNGKLLSLNQVSKMFKAYVRKTGLNDNLHFHSLRHTFASWLVQDGVSLYEVQKLLGHSNIAVTAVYSHLKAEGLHSTVNRISVPLN